VAVSVTTPGEAPGVRTNAFNVAGPESSVRVTGSPLDAWVATVNAGDRVEIPVGVVAERVWASRAVKLAKRDLLAVIVTVTVCAGDTTSPVQPAKALPAAGTATAVAEALAG
jgi:hypothetical protein